MKNLWYLFLVLFIISCSAKKEEVVSLDDLVSGSKENEKQVDTVPLPTKNKEISFFVNRFCDSLEIDKKNVEIDTLISFPERFHPLKTDKVRFKENLLISYNHWKWSDSSKSTQAFFNWLDQFGETRRSLLVGDEVAISKKGFLVFLQDKSIVYLEFEKNFKPEVYLQKLTSSGFGKHYKYVFYQQPKKKIKWIDCISDTINCPLYPMDKK